jgi:hypothetical protein
MINIQEFKRGVFILKNDDNETPMYARLIQCPGRIEIMGNNVSSSQYSSFSLPSPSNMDANLIVNLMANVSMTSNYDKDSIPAECENDLPYYYESVSASHLVKEMRSQLSNSRELTIKLPGLTMSAELDSTDRVKMKSSFYFFGRHQMSRWFLEILDKYLQIKQSWRSTQTRQLEN